MSQDTDAKVSISRRRFLEAVGGTSAAAAALGEAADDDASLALGGMQPMAINEKFTVDQYKVGPKSDRPKPANAKGMLWEVTDGNATNGSRRTFSDGSKWITLNVESEVVNTDELSGAWDHRVPADAAGSEIQTIIDNAAEGDVVVLPKPDDGFYDLDSPLQISKNLVLKGESMTYDVHNFTSIQGVWLRQNTGGANVIELLETNQNVDLENIGITWESSIAQSNTGHGIYADPPADPNSSYKLRGLDGCNWRNLAVKDVDPDHYGFYLINPVLNYFESLRTYYGGGIAFENYSTNNFGNTTVVDLFVEMEASGTAHGILHYGRQNDMNLNTFIRPQVNVNGLSTSQKHVREKTDTGGSVSNIGMYDADFESGDGSGGVEKTSGAITEGTIDSGLISGNPHILSYGNMVFKRKELLINNVTTRNRVKIDAGDPEVEFHNGTTFRSDLIGDYQHDKWRDQEGGKPFSRIDAVNNVTRWQSKGDGGMKLQDQDLSALSLGSSDDGDLYRHNGASSITLHDGTTTSSPGYYVWDNGNTGWRQVVVF